MPQKTPTCRRQVAWGVLLLVMVGCRGPQAATVDALDAAYSVVLDEADAPIAGARLTWASGVETVSDASGRALLPLEAGSEEPRRVRVAADGYEALHRTFVPERPTGPGEPWTLVMRRVGGERPLSLPPEGAPPAVAALAHTDGGVTLSVPPGSLVLPDGQPARGEAVARMTYWHPRDGQGSAPGAPTGLDASGMPVGLEPHGIASVSVLQGNVELAVAPGASVGLTFSAPAQRRAQLAGGPYRPDLYWLDPARATWVHAARHGDDGGGDRLLYDSEAGAFEARLTHLSAWSVNGTLRLGNGGCVRGRTLNACTRGPALYSFKIFFLTPEGIVWFTGNGDNDGRFCKDVGIADRFQKFDPFLMQRIPVNVFASQGFKPGRSSDPILFDTSSLCNPVPPAYQTSDTTAGLVFQDDVSIWRWNAAGIISTIANDQGWSYYPSVTYPDTCQPTSRVIELVPCSFCAGKNTHTGSVATACVFPNRFSRDGSLIPTGTTSGDCADLGDVLVKPPGCNCALPNDPGPCTQYSGCCPDAQFRKPICVPSTGKCTYCILPTDTTACASDGDCCPGPDGQKAFCDPLTHKCSMCRARFGELCSNSDECCPQGSVVGVCGDGICVPGFY